MRATVGGTLALFVVAGSLYSNCLHKCKPKHGNVYRLVVQRITTTKLF